MHLPAHIPRRHFLRALTGAAGLGTLGWPAHALTPDDSTPGAWQAEFDAALPQRPWLAAYAGVATDAPTLPMTVQGRWPHDLRGSLYRNGATRFGLAGQRYHHWFDGDGMVQRYRVSAQGISHTGRFVRTPKFQAETAAGRLLYDAFGTRPANAEPLQSPDQINVANISVMMNGGALYALWEGGSAMQIDPETLQTRGFKTWAPDYAGMAFSAHPKTEPHDGSVWNFGVSSGVGLLTIYHISAQGQLLKTANLKVPNTPMIHDFAITRRHLVFLMPPLVYEQARAQDGATFLDSHVWRPDLGMRVLVLPKDQLDKPQWLQLPAGFTFHVGNAWDDASGRAIHLDYVRSPNADLVQHGLREMMRGRQPELNAEAHHTLLTLDLAKGRATQQAGLRNVEFPRVDPRRVGLRHRQVAMVQRLAPASEGGIGFDTVSLLDVDNGHLQRWRYASGVIAEEHIVVPRTGKGARASDAWIVGTALDIPRQRMLLSVFDAQHLNGGPIAQASAPRLMPHGLHAIWVPESGAV
ncbi:carotenoid oxygenase family protein [Ottowia sp.]|uniref:carotenoid oxygenase family protein n=1 Tax=Ottowia sp. TaxID=1898956 RepID=UPI003A8695DD